MEEKKNVNGVNSDNEMTSNDSIDFTPVESKGKDEKVAKIFIDSKGFVKLFSTKVLAQKRISADKDRVSNIVDRLMHYIRYFNSLSEDVYLVLDHPINDWPILNELKDFIMPKSVRYESGNRMYREQLIRNRYSGTTEHLSYGDYINVISQFRGLFKKDIQGDVTPLDTLRVDKSFEEVRAIGACCWRDMLVHYVGEPFIPVPLKCLNNLVEDSYFNTTDVQLVKDYLAKLNF